MVIVVFVFVAVGRSVLDEVTVEVPDTHLIAEVYTGLEKYTFQLKL